MVAGATLVGCFGDYTEKLNDGASAIFVRATVCPPERVSVTPGPDLAPHTVLPAPPPPSPPAELAGDPERIRLWESQQPRGPDLDAIGKTFAVTGCGKTVLYVCAHPRTDSAEGPFSADAVSDINGGARVSFHTDNHADRPGLTATSSSEVPSSVICMPGG